FWLFIYKTEDWVFVVIFDIFIFVGLDFVCVWACVFFYHLLLGGGVFVFFLVGVDFCDFYRCLFVEQAGPRPTA
ncbi:hypothetical protein ACVGWD_05070, partial [Enterobacter asburiae]